MVAAINPITPVIAAESVAPDATLRPGSVIDARVLQVLANDFVRIAVSSLSIEVMSEVPLQAGQTLQLAVTQTPDGLRLQIVPQTAGDATSSVPSGATTISSSIAAAAPVSSTSDPNTVTRTLTPLEAMAVTHALQAAAAKQGSLSPLFANLNVAATSGQVPTILQQAAMGLLATRPALDEQLSGEELEAAFKKSGLFFEQSQKVQSVANVSAIPDMKAALVVFRQTLASWLGNEQTAQAEAAETPTPGQFAQQGQARADADAAIAPPLAPEIAMEEILLPGAVVPVAEDVDDLGVLMNGAMPSFGKTPPGDITSLQDILQSFPKGVQDAVQSLLAEEGRTIDHLPLNNASNTAHESEVPPPPFRGSAPSAQAIAAAGIDDHTPANAVAHRLLDDTDAALARQTLLQIASLPDQVGQTRPDMVPRWNFEIPFATPQGTAVAQFEISRDGAGNSEEAQSRVWRARFSLNLEPAGPVHAQISLSGERTSVRMWAERSSTVAQLQADAPKLSQALREAALTPGDIVIGSGAPPTPNPPQNGHFLDRAL
jgi:hypothetical protein